MIKCESSTFKCEFKLSEDGLTVQKVSGGDSYSSSQVYGRPFKEGKQYFEITIHGNQWKPNTLDGYFFFGISKNNEDKGSHFDKIGLDLGKSTYGNGYEL